MKQEIVRSPASRSRKAWLLGTASALAMGVTVLSPAWAAEVSIPETFNSEGVVGATGATTMLANPVNLSAMLSALIDNNVAATISDQQSSAYVTANSFTASAGGNVVTNSINGDEQIKTTNGLTKTILGTTLLLPLTDNLGNDGIAVMNNSQNSGVVATATVRASNIVAQAAASAPTVSVPANTMAANVTLNQSTTSVQGQVPINYAPAIANYQGAFSNANEGSAYDASASVVATTAQFNSASGELSGSVAMVSNSNIGQTITGANGTADVLNNSPAITANSLTAGFAGNSATTALTIAAGGATAFHGSTALTNVQQNSNDTGDEAGFGDFGNSAAIVRNSSIVFDLVSGNGGEEEPASVSLAGALAMTGNAITATAIGNQVPGTSLSGASTGNILTLADGIGLQGTSQGSASAKTLFNGVTPETDLVGDVLVNNWQNNNVAPLDSVVEGSSVTARLPAVVGAPAASVTLSTNAITAQTMGNQASNALLAPGVGSPATPGEPLFGVLALASLQSNQSSPLSATIIESGVGLVTDTASNAVMTVASNTVSASATGNLVANSINLNASSLVSYSGATASTFAQRTPTDNFAPTADVMLNSLQTNDVGSPVIAQNLGGGVLLNAGADGGGVTDSHLSVTGNTTAAVATGNSSANNLTLNGSVNTDESLGQLGSYVSAALVGAQSSYGAVTAVLGNATTGIITGEGAPSHSTLALNGNMEGAFATGNTANNTLTVSGSSISVANAGVPASVFSYVPIQAFPIAPDSKGDKQTSAGFIGQNDQATTAWVTATVAGPSMQIAIGTDGLSSQGGADNSANQVLAAASGNQATTQLTLSPSDSLSIYSGANKGEVVYSPLALVVNVQTLGNGTNVDASIGPDEFGAPPEKKDVALPSIYIGIAGGGLTDSTLSMTGNQIAAQAEGNNAINSLILTNSPMLGNVGAVTEPSKSQPLGLLVTPPMMDNGPSTTTLTADAAFVVHNMQFAGTSAVTAEQDGTGVQAAITGDIAGSQVTISNNFPTPLAPLGISAIANTNLAINTLTLGSAAQVVTNLSASGGLVNFQVSNGATSGWLGEPGSMPTPAISASFGAAVSGTDSAGAVIGINTAPDGSNWFYTGWLVSTDPTSVSDGFTKGYQGDYYLQVSDYVFDTKSTPFYGTPTTITNNTPGSPGAWGSPAFVITLNGNVSNSVLGITQNMVNAASTANAATNTVGVTAASSSSSLSFIGEPKGSPPFGFPGPGAALSIVAGASVQADVGLLNNQTLGADGTSYAEANGSFGISNTATAPVYTIATLSVSDNAQQASALGNTASNSLTLSPGSTPTATLPLTASILSQQTVSSSAASPVSSLSNMLISAPMALGGGSRLTMSGNSNTASAVANDVTNTLSVGSDSAPSLPGVSPGVQTGYVISSVAVPVMVAIGDYTVVNSQTVASGSVQAAAITTMLNNDLYLDPATVANTSISLDSNTTVAEGIGNRASNTLAITTAGSSGATGAVANGQINGASVGAAVTLDTTFAVGQLAGSKVGSSSNNVTYGITNNTAQALATGNQASNVLNASPAAYGTATMPAGSNVSGGGHVQATATYAVLNTQYNTGPVTATMTGVSPPLLASNSDVGQGGYIMALNTTGTGNVANVSGNTVTSQAIGNRASNAVTLAALNTGMVSTAINSVQQNVGAVSASISNMQIGAAVSGGTVARVGNNSLTANAIGNIVTNSITTH